MMKFVVLIAVLFVSTHANPFNYLNRYNNAAYNPYNLDTADDDQQQVAAQGGAAAQQNDDLDDGQAVAGGQQQGTGTTVEPDSDSSSSSSEEEAPDTGGTGAAASPPPPPGAPVLGPGQQGGTAGQDAGQSSNGDTVNAVGAPIGGQQQPGDTSTNAVDPGVANPLNMKSQAVKEAKGKQMGATYALTTLFLVAGVASVSAVAYKYKDAIGARLGL